MIKTYLSGRRITLRLSRLRAAAADDDDEKKEDNDDRIDTYRWTGRPQHSKTHFPPPLQCLHNRLFRTVIIPHGADLYEETLADCLAENSIEEMSSKLVSWTCNVLTIRPR